MTSGRFTRSARRAPPAGARRPRRSGRGRTAGRRRGRVGGAPPGSTTAARRVTMSARATSSRRPARGSGGSPRAPSASPSGTSTTRVGGGVGHALDQQGSGEPGRRRSPVGRRRFANGRTTPATRQGRRARSLGTAAAKAASSASSYSSTASVGAHQTRHRRGRLAGCAANGPPDYGRRSPSDGPLHGRQPPADRRRRSHRCSRTACDGSQNDREPRGQRLDVGVRRRAQVGHALEPLARRGSARSARRQRGRSARRRRRQARARDRVGPTAADRRPAGRPRAGVRRRSAVGRRGRHPGDGTRDGSRYGPRCMAASRPRRTGVRRAIPLIPIAAAVAIVTRRPRPAFAATPHVRRRRPRRRRRPASVREPSRRHRPRCSRPHRRPHSVGPSPGSRCASGDRATASRSTRPRLAPATRLALQARLDRLRERYAIPGISVTIMLPDGIDLVGRERPRRRRGKAPVTRVDLVRHRQRQQDLHRGARSSPSPRTVASTSTRRCGRTCPTSRRSPARSPSASCSTTRAACATTSSTRPSTSCSVATRPALGVRPRR